MTTVIPSGLGIYGTHLRSHNGADLLDMWGNSIVIMCYDPGGGSREVKQPVICLVLSAIITAGVVLLPLSPNVSPPSSDPTQTSLSQISPSHLLIFHSVLSFSPLLTPPSNGGTRSNQPHVQKNVNFLMYV